RAPLRLEDARANRQQVVEPRRALVPAGGFGDHDEAVVLRLHLLVLEAELPAKLDAPDFEPREIVAVVDHAHLVRLGVADANRRLGVLPHRRAVYQRLRAATRACQPPKSASRWQE